MGRGATGPRIRGIVHNQAGGDAMRRLRETGIVTILLLGLTGCAGVQQRMGWTEPPYLGEENTDERPLSRLAFWRRHRADDRASPAPAAEPPPAGTNPKARGQRARGRRGRGATGTAQAPAARRTVIRRRRPRRIVSAGDARSA